MFPCCCPRNVSRRERELSLITELACVQYLQRAEGFTTATGALGVRIGKDEFGLQFSGDVVHFCAYYGEHCFGIHNDCNVYIKMRRVITSRQCQGKQDNEGGKLDRFCSTHRTSLGSIRASRGKGIPSSFTTSSVGNILSVKLIV